MKTYFFEVVYESRVLKVVKIRAHSYSTAKYIAEKQNYNCYIFDLSCLN